MTLLIDNREDPKIERLAKRLKINYTMVQLDIGDFLFEAKNICVERKTISDFVQSIRSGHLQRQLANMSANYSTPFLIISGYLRDLAHNRHIKWTSEQHLGCLASLSRDFPNVRILQVDNDTQLVKLVDKLCTKIDDGKIKNYDVGKLFTNSDNVPLNMMCCLPGVGEKTAKKLMEKNHWLDILTNPDACDLSDKQKEKIKEALHISE